MFREKDLKQFESKGISKDKIEEQIENFKNGFPYSNLVAPATYKNGIKIFEEAEVEEFVDFYKENSVKQKIMKFVPASGAASRMFKHLFAFANLFETDKEKALSEIENDDFNSVGYFFKNIEKFAFYNKLKNIIADNGEDIIDLLANKEYGKVLFYLLDEDYMNYSKLPKGLLLFHKYENGNRLAMEEHLVEGAKYAIDENNNVHLHFTVSPEHMYKFKEAVAKLTPKYEEEFNVKYNIEFSIQKPETDTMAVNPNNEPFRMEDDSILFRPGGHGALIDNLNDLDADIVFIKNIDNVVPDKLKQTTYDYKMLIGAYIIKLKNKTFNYINEIKELLAEEKEIPEVITDFFSNDLMNRIPDYYYEFDNKKKAEFLINKLNRPIRICGMVENKGEPGGGPFWVDSHEDVSLQIVEKSQIDIDNPKQFALLNNSTHFNPVDLVCTLKDYKGRKFDLKEFIDEETGFISEKSKNGKQIKAQELPGLWNGAMADWNTIFVEVPIITFNPVKTVNDLLRKEHQ